jgi:fructose-bisphosphate aldolase/6-deoxy-5-ketofructose 1-phosphate synthase
MVPADVPKEMREEYERNYKTITKGRDRLMLFAGDQKVEHMNDDFYGESVPKDDADPEHLFRIASKARIGAFAAQLGLIAKYGSDYSKVPYIVKLNSKTHLIKTTQRDPFSNQWVDVEQVAEFKKESGLNICAVGYTIYPGSEFEGEQYRQAAQVIYKAHRNGLVTIIWAYPRGKAVQNESDPHIIAGAAGIVACLGSDFVKVNYPKAEKPAEALREAVLAAGRTRLLCAGGSKIGEREFLQMLWDQIHIGGASGNATGRNIHQHSLDEAIRMCNATYAITVEDKSVEEAWSIYRD